MRHRLLRWWLPLSVVLGLCLVGAASLLHALHQRQHQLTETSRTTLLADVARLTRLGSLGGEAAGSLMASEIAQLASRPQVQAVLLIRDDGEVLLAHRAAWQGHRVREVWPMLDMPRVARAAQRRLPDWTLSDDGVHMDALQAFDLPSRGDEVRSSRRALVYVASDLSFLRQQARHDEITNRIPDIVGWMLLALGMIWVLGRYVTGPLARLGQAAQALRAGQWAVAIPRGGFREIDHLASGLEALRQELAATWCAIPDLLFELDGSGRYLRVVATRPELLFSNAGRLEGLLVSEVLPPDAARIVMQALADAGEQGGVWGREIRLDVPAGQRWFEISVARKTAPDAGVPTYIVIARDVTERKLVEAQLRHLNEDLEGRVTQRTAELQAAKEEAERANQSKSEFLSRMSHELRTPLNAILGFGQLLDLSVKDPVLRGQVRQILGGGHHLLTLINEVLDLARVESGQMTVSVEPVALHDIAQECLALVRPQAEARAICLQPPVCPAPLRVMADRTRVKQVVLNLLSNAIKYNRQGGSVEIACVADDDWVSLRVTDTGIGLTPAQQGRLFVPFERLHADDLQIEGTGIGLALSKRLVTLMGGQIGAESAPGTGSTFWVRLARASDVVAVETASSTPRVVPVSSADTEVTRTVLCIEDNPTNLQLMDNVLGMLPGLRLLSAMAPGLGIELARTHRPDLILLDINLPDMDGYAVMRCLREHPATAHIPVVAVSANAMPQDIERGRAAGFADYLTKPLNVARLLRLVDEMTLSQPNGVEPA